MNADPLLAALLSTYEDNREYAKRLVADLADAELTSQPVAGRTMNHPAWVLAHLGLYGPIVAAVVRGDPFDDPRHHPFGGLSHPINERGVYPSKAELLRAFVAGYDGAAAAIRIASAERLAAPTPLERWRARYPTIAYFAQHMMVEHISVHLGQLSAWRRAGGRPSV